MRMSFHSSELSSTQLQQLSEDIGKYLSEGSPPKEITEYMLNIYRAAKVLSINLEPFNVTRVSRPSGLQTPALAKKWLDDWTQRTFMNDQSLSTLKMELTTTAVTSSQKESEQDLPQSQATSSSSPETVAAPLRGEGQRASLASPSKKRLPDNDIRPPPRKRKKNLVEHLIQLLLDKISESPGMEEDWDLLDQGLAMIKHGSSNSVLPYLLQDLQKRFPGQLDLQKQINATLECIQFAEGDS